MNTKSDIFFIEHLNVRRLLKFLFTGENIYYFNVSFFAKLLLSTLKKVYQLNIQEFEFSMSEVRKKSGEILYPEILSGDLANICYEISNKQLRNTIFVEGLNKIFGREKFIVFLNKVISKRISDAVIFINVIEWAIKNRKIISGDKYYFQIKYTPYFIFLDELGRKKGIEIIYSWLGIMDVVKYFFEIPVYLIGYPLFKFVNSMFKFNNFYNKDNKPLIAVVYTAKEITFDLKKRCDFFWLLKSNIPHEQVLIYFERKDVRATANMIEILKENKINHLALSKKASDVNIPVWKTTLTFYRVLLKNYFLLVKNFPYLIRKKNFEWLKYINEIIKFNDYYSFWYDFFKTLNVKIYINNGDIANPYSIPVQTAIEDLDGVSISYQWTNITIPQIWIGSSADVYFSFGPYYKNKFINFNVKRLIYYGYITDYVFKEVKEDSNKLCKTLHNRGVKFIIAFFDENSSDDRMWIITNKITEDIYRELFNLVIDNSDIGLICKPGYPKTLKKRIKGVSGLWDDAVNTGRCVFLDEGTYLTEKLPTEAAQSADLNINFLFSGTAAIESYLSGCPVVYLDLEKMYSSYEYRYKDKNVVFDNLVDFVNAIKMFSKNQEKLKSLRCLDDIVNKKDPFRDGQANIRIGQYIGWLLEMFNKNISRESAMDYADNMYQKNWGESNLVKNFKT